MRVFLFSQSSSGRASSSRMRRPQNPLKSVLISGLEVRGRQVFEVAVEAHAFLKAFRFQHHG